MSSDLGPLPSSDRGDDLQQMSLLAIRSALPTNKFLFRDERLDDKGVDGVLEVRIDGHFTNFRSQVQLKATDFPVVNVDGTVSYPIEIKNLNYLLNGQSPIYVLWIAPRNELRYAWARDEKRRLDSANPAWLNQKTANLRFESILTATAIDEIHTRILREGKLIRETHEALAQATLAEHAKIAINPKTLAVTDPNAVYETLLTSGLSLVSEGQAARVIQWSGILTQSQLNAPRIRLVLGFAHIENGDYAIGDGHLARSSLGVNELSDLDQHLLSSLRIVCRHHAGEISDKEYIEQEKVLARTAPKAFAIQHELQARRLQHLNTHDRKPRAEVWKALQETVATMLADQSLSKALKLRARLVLLYANTFEIGTSYMDCMFTQFMRRDMRLPEATPRIVGELNRLTKANEQLLHESESLLRESVEIGRPILHAEALVTSAVITIHRAGNERFLVAVKKRESTEISQENCDRLRNSVEQAVAIFAQAGCTELEIWAKLYVADWLEVCGKGAEAKKIANSVLAVAKAMGYQRQISRAEDHLNDRTEFGKLMRYLGSERDRDQEMSQKSDSEMREDAAAMLEHMELPRDRLPVIERELLSLRDIAREKMNWCRHLDLIQTLTHTFSPQTMYVLDPSRSCICKKFEYESRIAHPDWITVINAFKGAYCAGCLAREPKTKEPDN